MGSKSRIISFIASSSVEQAIHEKTKITTRALQPHNWLTLASFQGIPNGELEIYTDGLWQSAPT